MRPSRWLLVPICLWISLQLAGCSKNEAQALAAAKARIEKKEDAAAEIDLKNLLQRFPKSGEARFLLGLQSHKRGDGAAALIEYQRALDLKYPDSIVVPAIARALMAQGKTRQVIDEFSKTSFGDANATAELQALVAQAMTAEGDAAGASTMIDKAVAGAPDSEPVLLTKAGLEAQAGQTDQALAVLDSLIAAKPGSHQAWNMKGNVLGLTPGQNAEAMAAFRKALAIKPGDVAAQTGLVALTMQKGDIEASRKELDALRKVAPKQINTKFYEANLAYASGKYTDAQSIYQAILKVLPLNPEVLLNAAETELKLNATAQAETLAAKALTQSPSSVRARQVLAQVYLRMGQAGKASATLSSLIDSPRATPELLALAAQAQLMNGNAAAADQMYARMAKLKPSDPRLRTLIASSGFGKVSDDTVFAQLQQIAKDDTSGSADMALISAHLSRKQIDAALQALALLDQKRPNDPALQHLRGQILAQNADLAGARKGFEAALKINAAYYPSVAALAALEVRDNKLDAARQRFTDLLKAQPKDARAMLAIAELMERQQKPAAEVQKQIDAAVKAAPTDAGVRLALIAHLFSTGQFEAALNAAQAATTTMPDDPDLLELQARCFMRLRQSEQALTSYGKIVTLYPKSPRGHIGVAEIHLQNNELALAQRAVERALELSPNQPEAQAQAITLAVRRKQYGPALDLVRRVQASDPGDARGWLMEGEIEFSRANWATAAAAYRRASEKPAPGPAAQKLFATLVRADKVADADGFAAQWLASHPKDADFNYFLGDVALAKGKPADARRHFEAALVIQPAHALALNNLAMLLMQAKQPGALALAERAVRAAPNQADILDTLAQAQLAENHLSDAIASQTRAVALAPTAPDLRLALAQMLLQSGDRAKAHAELERLARLGSAFKRQDEVARLTKPALHN